MPIADSKKVAAAIHHLSRAAQAARAAVSRMEAIQAKFVTANPSVVDTPLQGNKAAVVNAVASLKAEVNKSVWDAIIAADDAAPGASADLLGVIPEVVL